MHIALSNFWLLEATGIKPPADTETLTEKSVQEKAEVIRWLKQSMEAVKTARVNLKPGDLQRAWKSPGVRLQWTASIFESSSMPTNTWGN